MTDQEIERLAKVARVMLAALKNIEPCVAVRGPHGLTSYFISDDRMMAIRNAIVRAEDAGVVVAGSQAEMWRA